MSNFAIAPPEVRLLNRLILLWASAGAPLLFWTASYDMFEMPKQLALKSAACGLGLLLLLGGQLRAPRAILFPLALLAGTGLCASFASPLAAVSLFGEYASYQGLLHWAVLGFLLLSLAGQLREPGQPRRFLTALAVSLLLISAYALIQLLGMDWISWSLQGPLRRTFSTAGNPLHLGFLLAAGLPLFLGLAAMARRRAGRLCWLGGGALVFAALLSSGSRGALGGSLLASLLFLSLARRAKLVPAYFWLKAGAALLLPLLLSPLILPADRNPVPLLVSRFAAVARGEDSRLEVWRGAARLIRQAPLLGPGLDTFAALHPRVQSPLLWRYVWQGSPAKAHNELIQLSATVGLLATGAAIWLLAILFHLPAGNAPAAAAAAGLLGLLAASNIGFLTNGSQALSLPLVALLLAPLARRELPVGLKFVLAAFLAVVIFFGLRHACAEVALKRAVADTGLTMDRALALKTPWAHRLLRAADTLEHRIFGPTLEPGSRPGNAAAARMLSRLYGTALELNPFSAHAAGSLARLAARAGRIDEALRGYERARVFAPQDAYLALEQVRLLLSAERPDDAELILTGLAGLYPDFAEPFGLLGYIALKKGDNSRAEPLLRKSLELRWHGNSAAAVAAAGNLAVLYKMSGRPAEAAWAAGEAQRMARNLGGL